MLRPYRSRDRDQVLEVWYQASLVAHHFLDIGFLETEREEIKERWLPSSETMVYEDEGRVIGFISLVGNEVGAVFVDPHHHRRGIGTSLMNWARDSRPFLELGVFEANSTGREFYREYGFQLVGRQIHEESGQVELRLRLG